MNKAFQNFWKRRFLLGELVKKGIRLKYRKSYLGIIWSLIEPLLTTIVLVFVFGTLYNNKSETFPLYVITGRLIYTFFSNSTKAASRSIRSNASMIKKVYVPKYLYPISQVLFNFIIFAISLIVLVGVDIYCKVIPTRYIFQVFPALGILLLLCLGIGLILSTMHVYFRDVEYLWNVVCMIIMYCSAIFYYPERLMAHGKGWILVLNPLYDVIETCRKGILGEPMNGMRLLYAFIFSIVCVVVGALVFKKKQDDFILHL